MLLSKIIAVIITFWNNYIHAILPEILKIKFRLYTCIFNFPVILSGVCF